MMPDSRPFTFPGEFPSCGCHYTTDDDGIHFCRMHKAAPAMLEACQYALEEFLHVSHCLLGTNAAGAEAFRAKAKRMFDAIALIAPKALAQGKSEGVG